MAATAFGIQLNTNWILLQAVANPSGITPVDYVSLGHIVAVGAGVTFEVGYGLGYLKGSGMNLTINNTPYMLLYNEPENIFFGFTISLA